MFNNVPVGARLKVYVDGGADFTGEFTGPVPRDNTVILRATNGKFIKIAVEAVVAVVEL